jgi:hypothetical protein
MSNDIWSYSYAQDAFRMRGGSTAQVGVDSAAEAFYPWKRGIPTPGALPMPRAYAGGVVDAQGRCWMSGGLSADYNFAHDDL